MAKNKLYWKKEKKREDKKERKRKKEKKKKEKRKKKRKKREEKDRKEKKGRGSKHKSKSIKDSRDFMTAEVRSNQAEVKNQLIEMQSILEVLTMRVNEVEEQVSDIKDKLMAKEGS